MTRVRFDPTFFEHPRWERYGVDGLVLHVAACSYVVRSLTDGHITKARVASLTPLVDDALAVVELMTADGFWRETETGYVVCDCIDDLRTAAGRGDEQPSRAFVESERKRARDRKTKWRERNGVGNAVPNSASGIAVQASPSPALHPPTVDRNGDRNAVPDDDGPRVPPPPDVVEAIRAARRARQVEKAVG